MKLRHWPIWMLAGCLMLAAGPAMAQGDGPSLAELARRARERRAAAKSNEVVTTLDNAKICYADWDCLLTALDEMEPARLRVPDTIDLSDTSGITITSNVVLEIQDCREERCRLTGRTENTTVRINDGVRARLLLRGYTPEDVNERERNAQAMVKPQDEARVNCVFKIDRLRYFLERRKAGHKDDKDWELADRCEGLDQTITDPFDISTP